MERARVPYLARIDPGAVPALLLDLALIALPHEGVAGIDRVQRALTDKDALERDPARDEALTESTYEAVFGRPA